METATQIKERPILFNAEMVRAILEGRKTQTRRVMAFPGKRWELVEPKKRFGRIVSKHPKKDKFGVFIHAPDPTFPENDIIVSPYGEKGDQLWVREKWRTNIEMDSMSPKHIELWEASKGRGPLELVDVEYSAGMKDANDGKLKGRWRSSIHMPRWASRIQLEVIDVRVEQVQDITEEDARNEGYPGLSSSGYKSPTVWFWDLWDSINKERGFGWESNPLVWVVEFKRIEVPA